ncbi:MAG: hypothetical protein QG630_422 [Patescibacteria group bacterium]|nr:hypothetical protein [Patescibacteria group bacterium]
MSIFFIQKNKNNNYLFSFFIPVFIFFPFLFSYIFFTPKNTISTEQNIYRDKAISLDEEVSGIEDAVKAADFREINDIIKDKDEKQETSPDKEVVDDIINTKSTIKILMFGYHQIREVKSSDGPKTKKFITSPEIFEKEMKFLSDKGYHTITTTDYINYLKTGKADFDLNKSFILTFDDGYASQYTNAFPILKKYNFTATFFIYSDCIDKYPACMTSQEIKDLAASGMKIASHTLNHVYLPKYSDSAVRNEIEENKQKIIDMVGTSSVENVFAYPYGGTDDRVENIVKSFGYDGAVGILASKKEKDTNLFNLKRCLLGQDYVFFETLFK